MNASKFREIEALFKDLKDRQAAGEISPEEMKAELKKMMLRGDDNRFWMLGGKSGSWYVHDGSSWNPADPYQGGAAPAGEMPAAHEEAQPAPQPDARPEPRFAPRPERDALAADAAKAETLCRFCHSRMDEHDAYCRFCGASAKAIQAPERRRPLGDEIQIRALPLLPLAVFLGGFGLLLGVVVGASFGIFKIFGDLIYQFPMMLQEMRGKFLGGLFFGALGGIAGFVLFAILGLLKGLLFNALSFVFANLRVKIRN